MCGYYTHVSNKHDFDNPASFIKNADQAIHEIYFSK